LDSEGVIVGSNGPDSAQTLAAIERSLPPLLPPGWRLRRDRRAGVALAWTVRAPDGATASFAVTVQGASLGRRLDAVVAELREAGGYPLVAAPFLSATVRETLAERNVSYADATGNLRLIADRPGLFVQRHGAHKDPWPTDDTLRSLRGRAAGRAVRALVEFRPPFGVRDVAKRAAVPLGSLSRTLDLLDREGLVVRGERGDVLDLDWERAVRRWADDYDFARSNRVASYVVTGGIDAFGSKLLRPKRPYAITGPHAAARLVGGGGPAPVPAGLYVEDLDLAVDRLGLTPETAEANVVLSEGYDRVVFERPLVRDGRSYAAPAQLAVDLLTWPGGQTSVADVVLDWMRANEGEWRA
jgi:hypothetical protein